MVLSHKLIMNVNNVFFFLHYTVASISINVICGVQGSGGEGN